MNSSLIKSTAVCFFVLCLSVSCTTSSSTQPLGGLQTKTGFDKTLTGAINGIAAKSASAIDIPTPKDAGGGYTPNSIKIMPRQFITRVSCIRLPVKTSTPYLFEIFCFPMPRCIRIGVFIRPRKSSHRGVCSGKI